MIIKYSFSDNLKSALWNAFLAFFFFHGYQIAPMPKSLLFLIGVGVTAFYMVISILAAFDPRRIIEIETNGLYIADLEENFMFWEEIKGFEMHNDHRGNYYLSIILNNGKPFFLQFRMIDADSEKITKIVNSQIALHAKDINN